MGAQSFSRLLRPSKVRSALARRWFERRLGALASAPGDLSIVELGTAYGGWKIPDGVVQPGWTCYSVGAGGDISFDLELISRYGATVRSIEPVEEFGRQALEAARGEPRFSFHQVALASVDAPIRVQRTHDSQSLSVSSAGLYDTDEWSEVPGRTLPSLMAELGDDRIDLLKVDVEGAEYDLLSDIDLPALGVKVFSVQLHHTGTVRAALNIVKRLEDQGYSLVAQRPAVKLTFLRAGLSGSGHVVEGSRR
jgi:FkbM family methyltransferase